MPVISPESVADLIHHHQIIEFECEAASLGIDDDLFSLGLDSMAMMQLMLHLEKDFGVRIAPADMTRNHFTSARVLAEWLSHPNRSAAA